MTLSTTGDRASTQDANRHVSPQALFLRGFLKHPVMVGSVVPSSQRLIRRMLAPVDWGKTRLFVEYGPGVGTFCQPILDRLAPDATLIAIDTNADFVRHLRRDFRDPRFVVANGSAADVQSIIAAHGFESADYVLSGLPFSTLPDGVGATIATATREVLRPGGAFLVYQFRARVRDFLAPEFTRIDQAFEWWNVPPAHLFWAWKD